MKFNKFFLFLLVLTFCINGLDAQLFDRLKKRTMDKLERKAEDKLVEELSEEIARRAFRPIDKAMDNMLRSAYEEENGGEVDWEEAGDSYAKFLNSLNQAANVPPSYTFDMSMEVEIKDGNKEKHKTEYFFSESESIVGVKQKDDGKESFLVVDGERDIVIIYSEENGKKSAQAVPSALKMAGAFVAADESTPDFDEMDIKKTGKTKTILGYKCEEYKIKSEKSEVTSFVSSDFPVNMRTAFSGILDNFMPKNYSKPAELMDGMQLYSKYKDKENKKLSSTWEAKKINQDAFTVNNSEYKGLEAK